MLITSSWRGRHPINGGDLHRQRAWKLCSISPWVTAKHCALHSNGIKEVAVFKWWNTATSGLSVPWVRFSSVQYLSPVWLFVTLRTAAYQASLSTNNSSVYSNSCPLSQWHHRTISSSVDPFSSHLQSFPESGCFPMSQFFASGGQSIGVSASASVLPMNIQDLISFRLDWLDLLVVQGTLKSFLQHHSSKASIFQCSAFFIVQHSHP